MPRSSGFSLAPRHLDRRFALRAAEQAPSLADPTLDALLVLLLGVVPVDGAVALALVTGDEAGAVALPTLFVIGHAALSRPASSDREETSTARP